jgi:hypothetical protein
MRNDALRRESCQRLGEPRADHDDQRLYLKQPLHFTGGNLAAADYQAAFAL